MVVVCSSFYHGYVETEKGIFDAILEGHIDFESQPWPSISNSAKDLVRKMLTADPKGGSLLLMFLVSSSIPVKDGILNLFYIICSFLILRLGLIVFVQSIHGLEKEKHRTSRSTVLFSQG